MVDGMEQDESGGAKPLTTAILIEASYRHLMQPSTVRIVAPLLDHAVRSAIAALEVEGTCEQSIAPSESTVRRHFKRLNDKFGWIDGFNPTPPARGSAPPEARRAHLSEQPSIKIEAHHREHAEAMTRRMGREIILACRT